MYAFIALQFAFSPSPRVTVRAAGGRVVAAPLASVQEPAWRFTSEQQRARVWFSAWMSHSRHANVLLNEMANTRDEMPPKLAEWGCDAELWSKIPFRSAARRC